MFPPDVTRNVAPQFDFKAWKLESYEGSPQEIALSDKVQLGGEILTVEQKPDGLLILGDNLPIVEHPKYGPRAVKR